MSFEDQMSPYTEAQRVRHLLAKLQSSLRGAIIKFHTIPGTRQELVALASRIEATDRGATSKRLAGGTQESEDRRKRQKAGSNQKGSNPNRSGDTSAAKATGSSRSSTYDKSRVECYGCHKKGHYQNECTNKHLWKDEESQVVRKVAASDSDSKNQKGKGKDLAKDRS